MSKSEAWVYRLAGRNTKCDKCGDLLEPRTPYFARLNRVGKPDWVRCAADFYSFMELNYQSGTLYLERFSP